MDYPSFSSLSATKSRGYRHRSRPSRNGTATARNDGKSAFRHRPRSSNESFKNTSVVIPFPVPSALETSWLIKTAPVVLVQHLVYARGLWPMSVPQLLSLQEATNREARSGDGICSNHAHTENETKKIANNKRQRLNSASRTNPSLRRKQQRATDQIKRLRDEWTRYATAAPHSGGNDKTNEIKQRQHEHIDLPQLLLILLGPSYTRGRELYLLDFQSLIDNDNEKPASQTSAAGLTQEQEQKYEAMLARKLVSALMNHCSSDEQLSVANTLPAPNSASFRLWFTAGFKDHHNCDTSVERVESSINECYNDTAQALSCEKSVAPSLSSASWIPRSKFPVSKQNSQSRPSSQTQSLTTIRFVRSRKQNQARQQVEKIGSEEARNDCISDHLPATSERLTWMSLPTPLKGFRL